MNDDFKQLTAMVNDDCERVTAIVKDDISYSVLLFHASRQVNLFRSASFFVFIRSLSVCLDGVCSCTHIVFRSHPKKFKRLRYEYGELLVFIHFRFI